MKLISLPLWLCLVAGCAISQPPPAIHHYFSKSSETHQAPWGYSGSLGPEHWADLDPSYGVARSGKWQSPINIDSSRALARDLPKLTFSYQQEKVSLINNGHSIQHAGDKKSFMSFGQSSYALEQFHVHAPSEHTIDGKSFPAEIHFVHQSLSGEVVVVAVLVSLDPDSKQQFPLIDNLPSEVGETVSFEGVRNPADFLPAERGYYTYQGSFTTPPCTEGVRWVVLKQPLGVRSDILERVTVILNGNRRPTQLINDRPITQSR